MISTGTLLLRAMSLHCNLHNPYPSLCCPALDKLKGERNRDRCLRSEACL